MHEMMCPQIHGKTTSHPLPCIQPLLPRARLLRRAQRSSGSPFLPARHRPHHRGIPTSLGSPGALPWVRSRRRAGCAAAGGDGAFLPGAAAPVCFGGLPRRRNCHRGAAGEGRRSGLRSRRRAPASACSPLHSLPACLPGSAAAFPMFCLPCAAACSAIPLLRLALRSLCCGLLYLLLLWLCSSTNKQTLSCPPLRPTQVGRLLTVGSVGSSRAVLLEAGAPRRPPLELSETHRIGNNLRERQRLLAAGCQVAPVDAAGSGPASMPCRGTGVPRLWPGAFV